MRTYRVVYRSLVASERLSQVSDSAAALFPLLLLSQDDVGIVLWTPLSRRIITATRIAWSSDDAERFLTELVTVGMVERQTDTTLLIRRGAELNGPPNHGRPEHKRPQLYADGSFSLVSSDVHGTYKIRTRDNNSDVQDTDGISGEEKRRIEENREEEKRGEQQPKVAVRASRSKTNPHLTDDEISALHAEYDAALTAQRVTTEIAAALDHKGSLKRGLSGSWRLYVDGWLRRNAAPPPALFRPGGSAAANGVAPSRANEPDYSEDQLRIADQMAHRAKVKGGLP